MICYLCGKPGVARKMCGAHYQKWRTYGDPLAIKPKGKTGRNKARRTPAEVFASHMPGDPPHAPSPTEGCWDWTGSTISSGYGNLTIIIGDKKTHVLATRLSYEIFVGPIPDGMFILHSCDRPICVQPAHLRPGSQSENMKDAVERGRWWGSRRTVN